MSELKMKLTKYHHHLHEGSDNLIQYSLKIQTHEQTAGDTKWRSTELRCLKSNHCLPHRSWTSSIVRSRELSVKFPDFATMKQDGYNFLFQIDK